MRLPRDLSGSNLANALATFGYSIVRQTGSHIRLLTKEHGEHYITIPKHQALRVGTLAGIVSEIAEHFELGREEVISRITR